MHCYVYVGFCIVRCIKVCECNSFGIVIVALSFCMLYIMFVPDKGLKNFKKQNS